MFKSVAVVSVLASVALAQIPSGISSGCTAFLNTLNNDQSLSACVTPLVAATSAFRSGTGSSDAVTSALNTLSSSNSCSESTIRTQLSSFYTSCTPELTTAKNQAVLNDYDVLYSIIPLVKAVASKDDSGKYCAVQTASVVSAVQSATGLDVKQAQQYLSSNGAANLTAFGAAKIAFLFLDPSLPQETLCTACTRSVLGAFTTWENDINYAPGLASSPLLSSQSALIDAINSKCGPSFMSGAVQAAGGLAGDSIIGAAPRSFGIEFKGLAIAIVGVLAASAALNF